ncbi:peptidoglycan-binding protein [Leptolyngbya sp. NK1-12]|uniref:Peptidoglycan-binding protein n=1 Tax=Leptolyngbya sp. NK1-12 TaxID=2547451 RepID=A0AA97APM4_9CYAN|nr:peptidoglycan-binding domain-containing protein [Leptolyngbya sp. NK1-12]WNZ21873.1 peptidoglycan-binding protein [Leptolyngbya sp. NK1-12]
MKSLSNYFAFADQSSGIPPKLKPFKVLTQKLSSSAWKGLLSLAVIGGVLSMTAEAYATSLSLGAKGPDVADVQAALGIPADGIFGCQTRDAVMHFQRRNGLLVDGVVGPETWTALFGGVPIASSPSYTPVVDSGIPVSSVPNNILVPGIKPPSPVLPPAVIGPYVVIVPGGSGNLAAVQQIVPNAVLDGALAGTFINAGGYPNYASAREVAGRLQGFGFDARVDYFERYRGSTEPPDSDILNCASGGC